MSGRQRSEPPLSEERDEAQPAPGDRLANVGNVNAPAQDGFLLLVPFKPLHLDRHFRVFGGEGSDCWRDQDASAKADDEAMSPSSGALHAPTGGVGGDEQRAGVVQQLPAGGGQPDGTLVALEERRAELALGRATERLSAGWAMWSSSAALRKWSRSATATK